MVVSNNERDLKLDSERLAHSSINGPPVTLAYMADDKTYVGDELFEQLTVYILTLHRKSPPRRCLGHCSLLSWIIRPQNTLSYPPSSTSHRP